MYLLQDERFRKHQTGHGHPESPLRLEAIDRGLNERFPNVTRIQPRQARESDLSALHTRKHVRRVRDACRQGRTLDADTPTSNESYETALLAVGGSLRLSHRMVGEDAPGFGAVRPPGHHAEPDQSMGFCLFNNIALVAERLTKSGHSVAIVDIDCHHGNGTQKMFYDRDDVLYVSFHQHPFYPGTGLEEETGDGDGKGYTLNVPLPAGAGWDVLEEAWTGRIRERLFDVEPDVLLVSAGFDAHKSDPLGGLSLRDEDYLRMGRDLRAWAEALCGGRRMGLLEGGYNLETLERLVPAFVEMLCGET